MHSYSSRTSAASGDFIGNIEAMHASFPSEGGIIVNEFACAETVDGVWSICDFDANLSFMQDAVPALLESESVARFAWFATRPSKGSRLFDEDEVGLNTLGQQYRTYIDGQ
mmetsp:Transcript_17381/g.45072  ORF Transcript_17381/g.45072 Transcript_17381/m.45072 type:complete len:111 (+) Transcript_17381:291-623(+)